VHRAYLKRTDTTLDLSQKAKRAKEEKRGTEGGENIYAVWPWHTRETRDGANGRTATFWWGLRQNFGSWAGTWTFARCDGNGLQDTVIHPQVQCISPSMCFMFVCGTS